MARFLPLAACTLCTASVIVYPKEYDLPVRYIDRQICILCPDSLSIGAIFAATLALISCLPVQAESGFKLYAPTQASETAPVSRVTRPVVSPTVDNSSSSPAPGVSSTSGAGPKIYYATPTGKPLVVDAASDPSATTLKPLPKTQNSLRVPLKTDSGVTGTIRPASTTVRPAATTIRAVGASSSPVAAARVSPSEVIHTSLDDFTVQKKSSAKVQAASQSTDQTRSAPRTAVDAEYKGTAMMLKMPASSAQQDPAQVSPQSARAQAEQGSAAPRQDPKTNTHLGANFSSADEVKAFKEKEAKKYNYVLPRNIPAPVDFKVVEASGFKTYTLPADLLYINDHAVFALKADKYLQELLPHVVKMADHPIVIRVHSDNLGFDSYNSRLSKERGEILKQWLVKNGTLSDYDIEVEGIGGRKPLRPNTLPGGIDDPKARAQNRRVELFIDTHVSVKERLAAERKAASQEELVQNPDANKPLTEEEKISLGRKQLQQAATAGTDVLPAALQEIGELRDEGMETEEVEQNAANIGGNGDSRQQNSWDRVAANQANRQNLNAEGKRVQPAMTEKEKQQLQKERDWARGEFGLFLEK